MRPALDNELSGPFWQAAENEKLVMTWCGSCDRGVWYPEPHCPRCRHELFWKPLSGRATLLAWTVVRRPVNPVFETPYIPALVQPEEAPHARLVTRMVDCEPENLRCDMSVKVQFRQLRTRAGESYKAPVFTPAQKLDRS